MIWAFAIGGLFSAALGLWFELTSDTELEEEANLFITNTIILGFPAIKAGFFLSIPS